MTADLVDPIPPPTDLDVSFFFRCFRFSFRQISFSFFFQEFRNAGTSRLCKTVDCLDPGEYLTAGIKALFGCCFLVWNLFTPISKKPQTDNRIVDKIILRFPPCNFYVCCCHDSRTMAARVDSNSKIPPKRVKFTKRTNGLDHNHAFTFTRSRCACVNRPAQWLSQLYKMRDAPMFFLQCCEYATQTSVQGICGENIDSGKFAVHNHNEKRNFPLQSSQRTNHPGRGDGVSQADCDWWIKTAKRDKIYC